METHMQDVHTITAFFDDRAEAQAAIGEIEAAGIPSSSIRMVDGNEPSSGPASETSKDEGLISKLKEMFTGSDDDSQDTHAKGLHRGGYTVSVQTPANEGQRVADILNREGSVDLDERSNSGRAEGWTSGADTAAPAQRTAQSEPEHKTIDVVEEDLRVGKRSVSEGRVRVSTNTVSEDMSEDVTLDSTHANIDRHAVEREVSAPDADAAFRDQSVEVEETSEQAVVDKTAHVVEEINVGATTERKTETVTDTVRHTEVDIDDHRQEPTNGDDTTRKN